MPAELRDAADPREWLRRARSNLELARIGRQGNVLVSELLTLAASGGVPVPAEVRRAEALTPYAVGGRYPGWGEDVSPEEFDTAIDLAQRVVDWAAELIEGDVGGEPPPVADPA